MSFLSLLLLTFTLLTLSASLKLEDESYKFCPTNYSHTIVPVNNSGLLVFNNSETQISCSVNLRFRTGSLYKIWFRYVIDEECFPYRTCGEIPIDLEIGGGDFCLLYSSYASDWTKSDGVGNEGSYLVKVNGHNRPAMQPFKLHYWTESASLCNQTTVIDEKLFSTYRQVVLIPYYYTEGPKNTTCLHRLEGIPAGAFLSVAVTDGSYRSYYPTSRYDLHFTVSNGTDREYIFSDGPPVFMRQTDGTHTLLINITSGSSRDWRFKYKYTVLICEDPPAVSHGTYTSTYTSTSRWLNGSSVIYTCDPGYEIGEDSSNNRTCIVVGSEVAWSNETVQCIPASCGPAPTMSFTTRTLSSDGLTASYRCEDHFNHTVGGTELVLKCSSLDPGNFPSEWRPVSNAALICATEVCPTFSPCTTQPTTPCPVILTTQPSTQCPACPAVTHRTPCETCPTCPTYPDITSSGPCTTVTSDGGTHNPESLTMRELMRSPLVIVMLIIIILNTLSTVVLGVYLCCRNQRKQRSADNEKVVRQNFPNSAYENIDATVADHNYEQLSREN